MMKYVNNIKCIVIFLILSTIHLIKAEFTPYMYNIRLTTELAPSFTFNGTANIIGHVSNVGTKNILLDASMKEITSLNISSHNTEAVDFTYEYDKKDQITITTNGTKESNSIHFIDIEFVGNLNVKPQGFTKVNVNKSGNKWMALTNFKPIYGREVLPCFEETITPMIFALTIIHHENVSALSNADVYKKIRIKSLASDGTQLVSTTFQDTPKMPISQLAFALVDLYDLREKKCHIYHIDLLSSLSTAIKMCDTAINHFETFLNLQLPVNKLNIIALNHLKSDIVVHVGLCIIHEELLIYKEFDDDKIRDVAFTLTGVAIRQWISNTKLAHHWRELWIADGITSYLQYEAIDLIKTGWNLMNSFGVLQMHNSFIEDIYPKEIELRKVSNPVERIYMESNVQKAASLIRMLAHLVTPKSFKEGFINYYKLRYKFGVDDINDEFWHEIHKERAHNMNNITSTVFVHLTNFMNEWTTKTGYPIVTIKRQEHNVRIEQKKYKYLNLSLTNQENVWQIPLTFTTSKQLDFLDTMPNYLLNNTSQELDYKLEPNEWIIFNIQQTGYYRVNYDLHNWKLITDTLMDVNKYIEIHQMNRAQLIDDSFHLSSASSIDDKLQQYEIFLNLTKYLVNENDYVPWKAAINCFDHLIGSLQGTEDFDLLRKYLLNQLHHFKNSDIAIGKTFEHGTENALHQAVIYDYKCRMGSKECVEHSQDIIYDIVKGHTRGGIFQSIKKSIAVTIFCTGIRHSDRSYWEYLYNLSNDSSIISMSQNDNLKITISLTCSRQPDQLEMLLKNVFKEENSDRLNLMCRSLSNTVEGRKSVVKFIEDNPNEANTYTDSAYSKCLSIILTTVYDRTEMNKINKIIIERFDNRFATEMHEAETKAEKNMAWKDQFYVKTVNWLNSNDETTEYLLPTDF